MSLVEGQGPTRVATGLFIKSSGTLCRMIVTFPPVSNPANWDPVSTERRKGIHVRPVGEIVMHTLFSGEPRGLQRRWLCGGGGTVLEERADGLSGVGKEHCKQEE